MQKQTLYIPETSLSPPEQKITHVKLPQLTEERKQETRIEGVENASKEATKTEKMNEDRFRNLVKASNQTLVKISSVFPFDFFPDEISIEIAQVHVVKRYFIATAHLQTIPIKNVADVFIETSLFFASLKIIDSSYIENSIQLEYLRKNEALKARRVIQGLVIANKEGIDLAKVPVEILLKNIDNLGKAQDLHEEMI